MRHRYNGAFTFLWHNVTILFQAWVLLLAVDLGLRLLPFRRVQEWMAHGSKQAGQPEMGEEWATVQRLHGLAGMAARYHLYPMSCLRRALVLQWLLGRQGICTDLRIGVRREAAGLCAHAWLEHGGRPIGEAQGIAASFAPLAAPEAGR